VCERDRETESVCSCVRARERERERGCTGGGLCESKRRRAAVTREI
jgi:hypothetical protein